MIFAKIGDSLECNVKQPLPGILKSRLDTKEAVAMANELLSNSNETGWRLVPAVPISTNYRCNVLNCGDGECVHKLLEEQCPHCRSNMVLVTSNGNKFCSNHSEYCDYLVSKGAKQCNQ